MKIHIVTDNAGEWVEFYVDDKLYNYGHHVRSWWFEEILKDRFGVEITREEKCLDDCHEFCECENKELS